MRRRSRASSKLANARSRKAETLKAARRSSSSVAAQETKVGRLRRELDDAREQQSATADVLKVISRSTFELQTVLNTLVESAARLCRADRASITLPVGGVYRRAASYGFTQEFKAYFDRNPLTIDRGNIVGRVVLEGKTVQIADIQSDPEITYLRAAVRIGNVRSILGVPMLREGGPVGVLVLARTTVEPFTDDQIALVTAFADQAVIAIENARLFNELRQSLQQQTATADVLKIISRSAFDLQTVLNTLVESAARLCDANKATIARQRGNVFFRVESYGFSAEFMDYVRDIPVLSEPGSATGRALLEGKAVHIPDVQADPEYTLVEAQRLGGYRTVLGVPMLREGIPIGVLALTRDEVRPFTDKQIELVQTFADQAAIAIENARLLNELRQRTTDLGEALEQQTASSEVLRLISTSPGDLEPVFGAILENATRICQASFGTLYLAEGSVYRTAATYNVPPAYAEARQRDPIVSMTGNSALARAAKSKSAVQITDVAADPAYRDDPQRQKFVTLTGARTLISVPMLKDDTLIGVISVYRLEVRPFTDKQIALVQNFAAQAVIAIENTRLLNELRERTEEVVKFNQQLEQRVADQVGEIERMGRLRRFLPPQVADLIVASGTEKQLESHRREITALFCDLRGFTGFSESSDPEDVMALLRDYHAAIGQIIIKYSGTLERFAGDGVMVVFNDPVPVENPAMQAVLMALEMRETIGALIEKWKRLGHDLGFGMGIAHGFATLGTIGFEGRFDYAAIGTVSNVASRLCDEAKPGQILISPRVLMAVEDIVTTEPVGEFTLKGIRRPLAAYNVLASSNSKPN